LGNDLENLKMHTEPTPPLRFIPSRVEGLSAVTEAAVYPDRLELHTSGGWVIYRFEEIARWPWPAALWRRLARLGWRPRWLPVGERDWFRPPRERFFRFDTEPPLVVYLPDEHPETEYNSTLFRRVQDVMRTGGFSTYDLG
jgi:hypothetical protein